MMERLEESKNMEAAERAKLEEEIMAKQEEVQRIQTEVNTKDEETKRLQVCIGPEGFIIIIIINIWINPSILPCWACERVHLLAAASISKPAGYTRVS